MKDYIKIFVLICFVILLVGCNKDIEEKVIIFDANGGSFGDSDIYEHVYD